MPENWCIPREVSVVSGDGTELERMNNVSSIAMDNSLMYTDSYTISQLFPSEAIHQRILLYNKFVIARAITKLLYNEVLKVVCNGKSPMHIIVSICLFGHTVHKTTFLIMFL